MPIRKKGDIDIRTSANGAKVKQTGYTFYSYDKKSAALYFQFRGQDGQPTDLGKATIHLVMILNDDGGKEFIPKSDEIEVISAIRGTAKYVLPEMLLAYQGKVTGYIYLDFEDGSQTDEGQFTFRIRRSMITHVLPEAGDKYVQDFEDVKERVEQAGDSATKDIEKAKDDAESQIGEYAGEVESAKDSAVEDIDKALPEVVESAKQDISSSASDVQSKASEASEDISGLVKSTEDARDDAKSQIGDYVGEVESAKNDISSSASDVQSKASEANEDIDDLVKSTEDARDEAVKSMNEIDYSNRNLLLDSDVPVKNSSYKINRYKMSENMENDIYTLTIKGNLGEGKTSFYPYIEDGNNGLGRMKDLGDGYHKLTFRGKIPYNKPSNKLVIYVYPKSVETESSIEWAKLNHGTLTMPWTPAPEDVGTKRELEKIKQAIINLGGSI